MSVADAAALQTFPPGHPFRGSRTKQYEQIGNAPRLTEAVIQRAMAARTGTQAARPRGPGAAPRPGHACPPRLPPRPDWAVWRRALGPALRPGFRATPAFAHFWVRASPASGQPLAGRQCTGKSDGNN
ncbi:hypothetical protein ACIPPR_36300 [Streptomyces nigra]|uniref:hypothetical protein n=1 Tax=Streptomyces nigra TaxID=1827580 RepID=UPI0037FA6BE2